MVSLRELQGLRKVSQENISTERGVYLRLCRSIQAEGAVGLLKTDFGFRRFLTRGRKNVRTELFFLALGFNPKKLWMKRKKGRAADLLFCNAPFFVMPVRRVSGS